MISKKLFKNCEVDPVFFFHLCWKTKEEHSDICEEELQNIVVIQNIFHLDNSFFLSKSLHFLFVRIEKRKRNFSFWWMHISEIKQQETKWILLLIKCSTAVGLSQAYYSSWAERRVEVKLCAAKITNIIMFINPFLFKSSIAK